MTSLLSMLDRFEQAAVTYETSTDKADRDELHAARRAIMEAFEAISQPAEPCGLADPGYQDCKNMVEVGGGMEGERYRCAVCGKSYFLDYEDMK